MQHTRLSASTSNAEKLGLKVFRTHAIEFGRATRESSGACVHTKDASHRRGLFSVGDCICYDLSFAEFMRLLCKKYVWAMVLEIWASVQNVASVLARCESSRENVVAFEYYLHSQQLTDTRGSC